MRWRRRKDESPSDADDAIRESLMHLSEAVRDEAEVGHYVARLRQIRQDNHLGPAIADLYGGRA